MAPYKALPHRDWSSVRDAWIGYLPRLDIETSFPEPAVWDFLRFQNVPLKENVDKTIPNIEGLRESVFLEAILLLRKFNYCRSVMRGSALNGFPTWSIVAAYDACFYGARAFCNILGIASTERHSRYYLDIFRSVTHGSGKRKSTTLELHVIDLQKSLTHETLWTVTARLCRTLSFPDGDPKLLESELRKIDFDNVSRLRNNIIYDGGFWAFTEMNVDCDLLSRVSHIKTANTFDGLGEFNDENDRYYALSESLARSLHFFLTDISTLAPALSEEANAIECWRSA